MSTLPNNLRTRPGAKPVEYDDDDVVDDDDLTGPPKVNQKLAAVANTHMRNTSNDICNNL